MATLNVLTGPQDAALTSSRTMRQRCIQYPEAVATMPRFQSLSIRLDNVIVRIDAAVIAKQSSRHTKNVTDEKNNRITAFMGDLDGLAILTSDMANEQNNSDWQTKAERALKTKTKSLSEEGLLAVGTEFMSFVKTVDAKLLADYGIDAAEIADMEAQIEDVKAWRVKKEVIVDQKTLDNSNLANLFKELKDVKATMERLSFRFAKSHPEFYAAFQKASEENLKLGVKTTKTEKEKTPEQLAVETAKKAVILAKKEAAIAKKEAELVKKQEAAAKKAEEKQQKAAAKKAKSKTNAAKKTEIVAGGSVANGNHQASAANSSILEVGKA
jgi:hypothetical protein